MLTLTGDGVTGWSAEFLDGQSVVGYRLADTVGGVIAEGAIDADWVRIGGTEQCGGPKEAEIELPA
ncbi:hypothetical protein [Salinibacterium sp. ZJ450]|uniref:hypothetical protein n=1 Tax=Salinibacterium sp. ZJ450 TaxID=2708338 RepID=UPI00142481CA|nr:hypothetical protein [Salinibacterium sp. ZJ450]